MIDQSRYPISQEEIDNLRERFPINGRTHRIFSRVIINRLLDECERLLTGRRKENKDMNNWFKFVRNGTYEIHINMSLIQRVVFDGRGQVFVDEFGIDGDSAERFRKEFNAFQQWRNEHV